MNNHAGVVAVVLAAGLSSRMGAFKPLLAVGGKPAVLRLLDSIHEAGTGRVVMVTGHRGDEVERAVEGTVGTNTRDGLPVFVRNERYEDGMFSSVQTGIRKAAELGASGALLFPVDVPLVLPDTIRAVAEAAREHGERFVQPCYGTKNGHPLYIPAGRFGEILASDGTGGLKAVRDAHADGLVKIATGDEGCVLDMDTPEDLARLRAAATRGVRRVFLVRHGEPRQHGGKIFLGQADVPLSERGREEAAAAGAELARLGARPRRLYASDLSRAKETADIIAGVLAAGGAGETLPVVPDKLFREMDMGSWDGELISDIREKFPEEYAKRGEDILNYRVPGGENFYELKGRVTREFWRVWRAESAAGGAHGGGTAGQGCDLVIVAHLGVVRALVEELGGEWPGKVATGSVTALDMPDWLAGEEEIMR